jgi:hypothetical protein
MASIETDPAESQKPESRDRGLQKCILPGAEVLLDNRESDGFGLREITVKIRWCWTVGSKSGWNVLNGFSFISS